MGLLQGRKGQARRIQKPERSLKVENARLDNTNELLRSLVRIVQQPSSGGRVAGARRNGGLILTLILELNPSVRLRHRNQETSHPRTLPLSSGANTSKVALTR